MSIIGWIKGCLSFTLANQSVDGLGKWYTKFRTGKFRAGITFTIWIIRSIYRETTAKAWKMALKKWNTNFCLEYSIPKNRLPFQMLRFSRKFSAGTTQEVVFHLLFNRVLRKLSDMVNINTCSTCTHYPQIKERITALFYFFADLTGSQTQINLSNCAAITSLTGTAQWRTTLHSRLLQQLEPGPDVTSVFSTTRKYGCRWLLTCWLFFSPALEIQSS